MKYFLSIFLLLILLYCINDLRAADHSMIDTAKHKPKKHITTYEEYEKIWNKHRASYDDCVFNNRFSLAQRLAKYPFSKAMKIIAVSYSDANPREFQSKSKTDTNFKTGLNIKNKRLYYSSLKEIIQLKPKQIVELSNIIYNTAYRRKDEVNYSMQGKCFEPRNALIFYDKHNRIFDYVEVCFECHNFSSLSDQITIGTVCTQKYDLLKQFFVNSGIKYGTLKTD